MNINTLIIAAALLLACRAPAAERARPNILFIFSDDHAQHAISAYGSKVNQTPQSGPLAKGGRALR
jgi:arylsulfatase A-like enzyme